MTKPDKSPEAAAIDRRWNVRGASWLAVAVVLAFLTGGMWFALDRSDNASEQVTELSSDATLRDLRINSLEEALKAQRAQFKACQGQLENAPGCSQPIAPEPEEVKPEPELIQGLRGLRGLPGVPGPEGPEGDRGPRGPQGFIGPVGPTGPKGAKGDQGNQGVAGAAGNPGADGKQGPPGADGKSGDKGDKGDQGPAGSDGTQGPAGEPGPQGPEGPQGPVGPQGPPGTPAPTIVDVFFGNDPANCVLVLVMSDGNNYAAAAPSVLCSPASPG